MPSPTSAVLALLLLLCLPASLAQDLIILRSRAPSQGGGGSAPVVLGASLALDCCSAQSSVSRFILQAWEVFLDQLDRRGGLWVSGAQRPLEIRVVNDRSRAAATEDAYRQHLADGVRLLLLGPASSSTSAAVAGVADEAGAVLVCPTASDTNVSRGRPTVFSLAPASERWASGAFEALLANGAKTAAYVVENTTEDLAQCLPLADTLPAHGLNLTFSHVLPFHPERRMMKALVKELRKVNPDVIFTCMEAQTCRDMVEEILALEFNPGAVVMSSCVAYPDWASLGEQGLFFTGTTPWLPSMPLTSALINITATEFARPFLKAAGQDPPYHAAAAFAALEVLLAAIERANATDARNVSAQLHAMRLQTVYGTVQFDHNNQVDLEYRAVQPVKVGAPARFVSPLAYAQAPMVYPMPTPAERSCLSSVDSVYGYDENGVCVACPDGYASIWNETAEERVCWFCPAGYFVTYDELQNAECIACAPGSISITEGQTKCANCSVGMYTGLPGQSECLACPAGTFQTVAGASACQSCPPGTFNSAVQQTMCHQCAPGTFGNATGQLSCALCEVGTYAEAGAMLSCVPCSGGRVTSGLGAHDARACVCPRDAYFDGAGCVSCPAMQGTSGPGATSRSACTLTDNARVMVAVVVTSVAVIPAFVWTVWAYMRAKLRAMEELRQHTLQSQLHNGLKTINEFAHPMVVVSALTFLRMTDADLQLAHEEARERGLLKTFDSVSDVRDYRSVHPSCKIVLFSYEWLSWVLKGPSGLQARWMRQSLQGYCQKMDVPLQEAFVWLDVLSIPQKNKGVQILAVNSLYTYASSVDIMIVIAPETVHSSTGELANLETYKRRVWTRMEQVAYVAAHGVETLFIATAEDLQPATVQWIEGVVDIFSGDMTCCRLKHANRSQCDKETLVAPLLGLWYLLSGGAGPRTNSGAALLYGLIRDRTADIFPASFAFETDAGVRQRPLFSDLIPLLQGHLRRKATKEVVDEGLKEVCAECSEVDAWGDEVVAV